MKDGETISDFERYNATENELIIKVSSQKQYFVRTMRFMRKLHD